MRTASACADLMHSSASADMRRAVSSTVRRSSRSAIAMSTNTRRLNAESRPAASARLSTAGESKRIDWRIDSTVAERARAKISSHPAPDVASAEATSSDAPRQKTRSLVSSASLSARFSSPRESPASFTRKASARRSSGARSATIALARRTLERPAKRRREHGEFRNKRRVACHRDQTITKRPGRGSTQSRPWPGASPRC